MLNSNGGSVKIVIGQGSPGKNNSRIITFTSSSIYKSQW